MSRSPSPSRSPKSIASGKDVAAYLTVDPKLRYQIPAHRRDGAQLLRSMFSSMAPPTAVYIADPMVAVGALNEAHRIGVKIPEDLSLLGFDDADLRHNVYPHMTAICQDARHIGRQAFASLAKLLAAGGGGTAVREISSTWLEINETTGAPASLMIFASSRTDRRHRRVPTTTSSSSRACRNMRKSPARFAI